MQGSVVQRQAWKSVLTRRVRRSAWAAREQLARYLGEIAAYWNRQPIDRFWPPHP
jgi:hypothetical protein